MNTSRTLLFAMAFILFAAPALAAAPSKVPLQGHLTDADGVAIDGDTTVHFSIYTTQNGLDALWTESQILGVNDGAFVAYLGDVTALPLTLFRDHDELWLGIRIEEDGEMERVRLGTTPYSGYAEHCGNIPDHAHEFSEFTGSLPEALLPEGVALGAQSCEAGKVVSGLDASGHLQCVDDAHQVYTGLDFALSGQGCGPGTVASGISGSGVLLCSLDANTLYDGTSFALSNQSCSPGFVVTGIGADGVAICGVDSRSLYSGADFATSDQGCPPNQVVRGIDGSGNVLCAPDADTTYSGANFTLSNQTCPPNQVVTGTTATGTIICAPVNLKPVNSVYRWNQFDTYQDGQNWLHGNSPDLFGGVNPSNWTDNNYMANSMSSNSETLRALFTRKGFGGANANVTSTVFHMYSSTNGKVTVALFRIRNTTSAPITWTPYFRYTCYAGWSERASVSLNGASNWNSGATNCGVDNTASVVLSLPANTISTVVFVSTSSTSYSYGYNIQIRTNLLAFYNNSLTLPAGLEYLDDLDSVTGNLW